ncbi:MAG: tetratricopeptide repeat protein [Elusimicrobia bacterium]|nr:tetratricopeptide repeat protein [Elusimicrobiota bacterium]
MHFPVLGLGFLNWDDNHNLLLNEPFLAGGVGALRWAWTTYYSGLYMPLTWMSFGLDKALWGLVPFGFHLTNWVLHAVNAVLFFSLSLALFRHDPESVPPSPRGAVAAALAALLFSIHPLRVESVAWITERKDVLGGFFFLLSLLLYVHAADPRAGKRARGLRTLSLGSYLFSLLSKPIALGGPLILLALDYFPLQRWTDRRSLPALVREKIPHFALAGAGALLALATGGRPSADTYGWDARLTQSLACLPFYLLKTFWPNSLAPVHEFAWDMNVFSFPAGGYALGGIALMALIFWARARAPGFFVAGIVYLALLAPIAGLLHRGPQWAADRYTYLSCLGWAVLAGGLGARWVFRAPRALSTILVLAAIALLGGLATTTRAYIPCWRDSESLWRRELEIYPWSYLGNYNLGTTLLERDRPADALPFLTASIRLHPEVPDTYNNRGRALLALGRPEDAGTDFSRALALNPAMAEARVNRGQAFMNRRRFAEAALDFAEAARLRPDWTSAWIKLGLARRLAGDLPGAAAAFRRALDLDPQQESVRRWLAELPAS